MGRIVAQFIFNYELSNGSVNTCFPRNSRSPHRRLGTSQKLLGQFYLACLNALQKIVAIVRLLAHCNRLFWNQISVQWADEGVPETKEYFHSRR